METVKLSGVVVVAAMIITGILYWILQHYTVLDNLPTIAFMFAVVLGCIVAGRSIWNWLKNRKAHGR